MTEAIFIGAILGYSAFVAEYLGLKFCRLCCIWWLSVLAALVLWNAWVIGVINIVAHASYKVMNYAETNVLDASSREVEE